MADSLLTRHFTTPESFRYALSKSHEKDPRVQRMAANERRADISVTESEGQTALANGEKWGRVGDVVDFVATGADLGAHHNLIRGAEALRQGDLRGAAGEVAGAAARVAGAALLNKGIEKAGKAAYRLYRARGATAAPQAARTLTSTARPATTAAQAQPMSRAATAAGTRVTPAGRTLTQVAPRTAQALKNAGQSGTKVLPLGRGTIVGESAATEVGRGTRALASSEASAGGRGVSRAATSSPRGGNPASAATETRVATTTPKPRVLPRQSPSGPQPAARPTAPGPTPYLPSHTDAGAQEWVQQMKRLAQLAAGGK